MDRYTTAGILAILFWSSNVAFSRSVAEQLGVLTSGAIMFLGGGLISLVFKWWHEGNLNFLRRISRRYLFGCGVLFVANVVALQLAIGIASSRTQTLIVGLINYLWPAFSLILAPVILKKRARWFLPLGVALALAGIYLACTHGEFLKPGEIFSQPVTVAAYGLALIAAMTWGFYSNLSRKWGKDHDGGAIPLFLMVSGAFMGFLRLFRHEVQSLQPAYPLELAYVTLFPIILAFAFWDIGMRRGRMILLISLSYFIPLFSTLISSIRLGVSPGIGVWLAAVLIMTGAMTCKLAVSE